MERDSVDDIRGTVFDIQRYSIHDGEGIRTTVFLKGCPLRCKWCANPESWSDSPQLLYSGVRCIKCGTCSSYKGITMRDGNPVIQWDQCDDIVNLAEACPSGAMRVKGERMSVAEVMREVEKDIPFYKKSNGGVTISGGEPLLQADFVEQLLKACKEKGLHTLIETSGYVAWEAFERVLPFTDQFFYDVKLADNALHRKYTGVLNDRIMDNLARLAALGAAVCVRAPVIPTINDNVKELDNIAHILKECKISNFELLPFHQYGKGKYSSCGIAYELEELETMSDDAIKALSEHFNAAFQCHASI